MGYTPYLIATSFARLIVGFLVAFVAMPVLLFGKMQWDDGLEDFFARVGIAAAFNMAIVYLLAATKLYELPSLALAYLLTAVIRVVRTQAPERLREMRNRAITTAFDVFDGIVKAGNAARRYLAGQLEGFLAIFLRAFGTFPSAVLSLTTLWLIGLAAYLRMSDAVANAAPALSDSYVTLAWMKYINERAVFHDGIYPQGFHIILSVLHKISKVNPLLVLKYVGPLDSILIILSTYLAGLALSRRAMGGVVAAFAYTALTRFLPYEYARQAATNSQEFAMAFLLPSVVFAFKYLQTRKWQYLAATVSCLAVIGMAHMLIALFAAIGVAAAWLATMLTGPRSVKHAACLAAGGVLAGIASAAPLLVGMALGIGLHASSLSFALTAAESPCPPITPFMLVALVMAALGVAGSFVRRRSDPLAPPGALTALVLLAAALFLYQGPRFGIESVALNSRSGEFAAVAMSVAYGVGWGCLMPYPDGKAVLRRLARAAAATATLVAVLAGAALARPTPARPYKMQYNSWLDQYLRISQAYRPSDWLIVSDQEGYAVAFGQGWHLMMGDFLQYVSPIGDALVYAAPDGASVIDHPYVFIFHERVPYYVEHELVIQELPKRVEEERRIVEWVEEYRKHHDNLSVFYEDKDIVVWLITQPRDEEEAFEAVWGARPPSARGDARRDARRDGQGAVTP